MNNKTIWIAQEGTERFEFQAKSRTQALIACEMWNAILIGKKQVLYLIEDNANSLINKIDNLLNTITND